MPITDALANRYYDALVLSVGTPDIDYLRWSFVYSLCNLRQQSYRIVSRLGDGLFSLDRGKPTVTCNKDLDRRKEAMLHLANHMIREIHAVTPSVKAKTVPIVAKPPRRVVPIKVRRVTKGSQTRVEQIGIPPGL